MEGPKSASPPPSLLGLPRPFAVEIANMLFVAGEVREPLAETIHQVEDIVKSQVIELAVQARTVANLRGSRALAPEDLIFLIRHDRPKVNRLRTFLSWMNVRKNARQTTENAGIGVVGVAGGLGTEGQDSLEEGGPDQLTTALPNNLVKLPWELTSIYSEFLDQHHASLSSSLQPSALSGFDLGLGDFSASFTTEHEDQLHQLYRDNLQRLKTADEVTKNMTKDEYAYYSECRQASFTFRKAKRFRDFINFSLYLEAKPSDDIIDILGFLAFEVVHTLGVQALQIKRELEGAPPPPTPAAAVAAPPPQPVEPTPAPAPPPPPPPAAPPSVPSPLPDPPAPKGGLFDSSFLKSPSSSLSPLSPAPSLPSSPSAVVEPLPASPPPPPPASFPTKKRALPVTAAVVVSPKRFRPNLYTPDTTTDAIVCSLFASAPREANRTPLRASHILEAYARIQRKDALRRTCGMGKSGRRTEEALV